MKVAIANLLNRRDRKRIVFEVEEELQFHIEMLERKFTQHGMSFADAKAAALRRFGNLERTRQQCVEISRRNSQSLLRRVLKASSILIGLTGLLIRILSSDLKVAHLGDTLMMIAISGRLLLYVRGLSSSISIHKPSLSVVSEAPEDGSNQEKPECSQSPIW
jgi:hypothetical protein